MELEYGVIFVNFNPKTGTDYIHSRLELEPSSSLAEALSKQAQFLSTIKTEESYRCYIQEREAYTTQVTRTRTVTKHIVKGIHNIIELSK